MESRSKANLGEPEQLLLSCHDHGADRTDLPVLNKLAIAWTVVGSTERREFFASCNLAALGTSELS